MLRLVRVTTSAFTLHGQAGQDDRPVELAKRKVALVPLCERACFCIAEKVSDKTKQNKCTSSAVRHEEQSAFAHIYFLCCCSLSTPRLGTRRSICATWLPPASRSFLCVPSSSLRTTILSPLKPMSSATKCACELVRIESELAPSPEHGIVKCCTPDPNFHSTTSCSRTKPEATW